METLGVFCGPVGIGANRLTREGSYDRQCFRGRALFATTRAVRDRDWRRRCCIVQPSPIRLSSFFD